jgi:hypothetical protein
MNPFGNENHARGASAVDALLRQQKRAAACNATQRGATPCNAMQQKPPPDKTNPPISSGAAGPGAKAPGVAAADRKLHPITEFVLQTAIDEACNAMQPDATPCIVVQQNPPVEKTNPPPPFSSSRHLPLAPAAAHAAEPGTLTPRQLAAARLIAAGRSIANAAADLGLNRTTVWRWTREPAFREELRQLHRHLAAVRPPGRR